MTHGGAPLRLKFSKQFSILFAAVSVLAVGCRDGGRGGGANVGNPAAAAIDPAGSSLMLTGVPPGQIVVGEPFTFTPTVYNPRGLALRFSASNLPDWLSIDASTGEIVGEPDASRVGVYRNIRITVRAGGESYTSPPYHIDVVAVAFGSVTLNWYPPTQNADGSALTDLAGYRIYFGRSANALTRSVTIKNAGATSVVIDSLTPAVWYFAATAYNADGIESGLSNVAALRIM